MLPQESLVLDGEMVVLEKDSISDFDAPTSPKHNERARLYPFVAGRRHAPAWHTYKE
jgi:ATP-dependent DNA ligase